MLWLCLSLPRLPLDALAEAHAGPLAVAALRGGRRVVVCANDAARRCGIADGIEASAAQALAPPLRLVERSLRAEREALESVAAWAYQFTDRLAIEHREVAGAPFAAVLAEIQGSLALFGGLSRLRARLKQSFAPLGYAHRIAVAPAPAAAEALVRAGDTRAVTRIEDLRASLAPLPLAALDLPAETRAALHGVGVRTAGAALLLPYDQLARRFGAALVLALRRLTGDAADPRVAYEPPRRWRRRFEMAGGIESVEALAFPLKRLLLELEGALVARDAAVTALALSLEHEGRPPTALALELAAPRRDAQQLLGLLREKLERATVAAPVTALALEVARFAQSASGQRDFFDDTAAREDGARAVLERIAARLGPAAVQGMALREDHRPERSFAPAAALAPLRGTAIAAAVAARPLWLLPEPKALAAPPKIVSRPERIESGWWDGAGVARDYYVAETREGSRLWVFRECGRWYLHGVWS